MKQVKRILFGMLFVFSLAGCSKAVDKPNDENEHESINGIELIFSESGGPTKSFMLEDADGDGGNPPSRIDTIFAQPNKQYSVVVKIFNIKNGVSKDLTATIQSQGVSHEFYFIPTKITAVIQKTDRDKNGYPIGIQSNWQFSAMGSGSILLKLMHKTALKGPNDGPNVGHSDIQISLPTIIK
ncbi:MAG: hypothetical protein EXR15_08405 [Chitinophagaceae bacterium]|nr:hypothetical protein [Chitinophagaceae bacterium]